MNVWLKAWLIYFEEAFSRFAADLQFGDGRKRENTRSPVDCFVPYLAADFRG
jgi:hypothetical protein